MLNSLFFWRHFFQYFIMPLEDFSFYVFQPFSGQIDESFDQLYAKFLWN